MCVFEMGSYRHLTKWMYVLHFAAANDFQTAFGLANWSLKILYILGCRCIFMTEEKLNYIANNLLNVHNQLVPHHLILGFHL